jgi:Carboxypeptidase regulatory-like domain/TonB dependent receptor-like, beta-barrel
MSGRLLRFSPLLLILMIGVAGPVVAQQPGASAALRGRVLDPQKRGVSARVQVIYPRTGLTRETQADPAGHFALPAIAPGDVDLVVSAPGFADRRVQGIHLEVGQPAEVEIDLHLSAVEAQVTVAGDAGTVNVLSSVVGSVVSAREIESLPLNGRNFLELAFLTAGSAPAPNFDPTKAQSVLVSSAGQAGRGGNITIDGMDDNDDVVGGPLQNISQDAVQEFQVATNRFSAELGRSASSVINVVTRSGGDSVRGSAAVYLRDQAWQALPATLDPALAGDPPFNRQQVPLTLGGPLRRGQLFGFGSVEMRNQNGGILVGIRNPGAQTINRTFARAPLDDLLGTFRLDWRAGTNDSVMIRYSGQREDDTATSALDRAIGTASQRQQSRNRLHAAMLSWNRILSPRAVNAVSVSFSHFDNAITPVAPGVQLTFPSLLDGSSFRVPQGTTQGRWQFSDALSLVRGTHQWKFGGEVQRVDARFDLGVFRDGRIEFVEDFPDFDRTGDGRVNDDDLLFAVTLRSGKPDQDLVIPDADNVHLAGYAQDDWRIHPRLSLSLGVRYEIDTDVNNISRVDELNPIVLPFANLPRRRDLNNVAPRVGFNWSTPGARFSVRGGYGIYYDRITLEIESLERGLDGRALPIEVRAGSAFFADPVTGTLPPFSPTVSNPFTGFILPGAGASGINIIDSHLQNPMVQQASIGFERQLGARQVLRVDVVHNHGTDFIIGRTVGTVFNPVVGGPDRVVNLGSNAKTNYNGLLVDFERRYTGRVGFRAAYTLSKSMNYANDDQIPFGNGPIDPDNLAAEYGPAPNDQRHRLSLSGVAGLGAGFQLAGLLRLASGVPMDILMPDGQSRIPVLSRNAGGRQFTSASELNSYIGGLNAQGGIKGAPLPLVSDGARFNDSFSSLDLRVSRTFAFGRARLDAIAEVFNLFNTTNILGTSTVNYSGFSNVLVRDSNDPTNPGFQRSSQFGKPVSTAGGVFGSGGPRALQLGARVTF